MYYFGILANMVSTIPDVLLSLLIYNFNLGSNFVRPVSHAFLDIYKNYSLNPR